MSPWGFAWWQRTDCIELLGPIFPIFSVVLFRVVRGKVNIGDKVNINEIKCSGSKLIRAIRIVISGLTVAIIPLFNRSDPLKESILYFLLNIIISEEFLK